MNENNSNYDGRTPEAGAAYDFICINWTNLPSRLYLNKRIINKFKFLEEAGIELKLRKERSIN